MLSDHFKRDDYWQSRIATMFLDPFYRSRGWHANRYPSDHPMQRLHVDVTLSREGRTPHHIDEKIIRGRRDGKRAEKVSLETWSCSVPGRKVRGWIAADEASKTTILHVCFADTPDLAPDSWAKVRRLDCIWIPFRPLREWFAGQDENQWELQDNEQSNHSLSRKVWIRQVFDAVPHCARFSVKAENEFYGACRCGAPGLYVERGTWFCQDHYVRA